ncbi:hypothetical protein CAPTEDRAFT_219656 [Capitella teleta]|uniref:PDZ domain-containing protein n=1 Tax=Capitella teleta TaxID=283909 RepID=R7U230_CAPTE|nr:hypothetical protein CAPTEDRAFT_219656 [Capitella teleta]|eukprot:ELT97721.1 hypothetical protein CAPTEDRAFT_219656 [Capitella teleta]
MDTPVGSLQRGSKRNQHLSSFITNSRLLLNEADREYVCTLIKDYQQLRQVDELMLCLTTLLDTPAKLDLLKDVRHFISAENLAKYDRLAPYSGMAHPWKQASPVHHFTPAAKRAKSTPQHTPNHKRRSGGEMVAHNGRQANVPAEFTQSESSGVKTVTVFRDQDESFGFSIRGGSEHGLGIFVSEVEENSAAERAGLDVGDLVMEANTISFQNISSSSAVNVLTGSSILKLVVQKLSKLPNFQAVKEKTSWFDVKERRVYGGVYVEHGGLHRPITPGGSQADGKVRRVSLPYKENRKGESPSYGFNVRGGGEYGLGLFISKVMSGSIAEMCALKVGDQILKINGVGLEGASHGQAVELMKLKRPLILTVIDTGKYPVFKEVYAEYSWTNANSGIVSSIRSTVKKKKSLIEDATDSQLFQYEMFKQYPMETPIDSTSGSLLHSPGLTSLNNNPTPSSSNEFTQDEASSLSDVSPNRALIPARRDLAFQERSIPVMGLVAADLKARDGEVSKDKGRMRKNTPQLAVRAMEMETRRKQPELVKEMEAIGMLNTATEDEVKDSKGKKQKSKSVVKSFFFNAKEGFKKSGKSSETLLLKPNKSFSDELTNFESSASQILAHDEVTAISRRISQYMKHRDVSALVPHLMAILDTKDKAELLTQIRSFIHLSDISEYDDLVRDYLASMNLGNDTLDLNNHRASFYESKQEILSTDEEEDDDLAYGEEDEEVEVEEAEDDLMDVESIVGSSPPKSNGHKDWVTIRRGQSYQFPREGGQGSMNLAAHHNEEQSKVPPQLPDLSVHRQKDTDLIYKSILDDDSIDLKRSTLPKISLSTSSFEKEEVKRAKSELADSRYMDSEDLFPVHPAASLLEANGEVDNGHFIPEKDDLTSETSVKKPEEFSYNNSDSSDDTSAYHEGLYNVNGSLKSSNLSLSSSTPVLERVKVYDNLKCNKSPPIFKAPPPPNEAPPIHHKTPPTSKKALPPVETPPPHDTVVLRHKTKKENQSGSLRDVMKARSTENIFKETADMTDQLASNEQETDYIRMSNDLIQNFIRQSRLSDQSDHSDQLSELTTEHQKGFIVAKLDKTCSSLGMSISGGVQSQPVIKIHKIFPGGAAHADGNLKPNMQIVSIDGVNIEQSSHAAAVQLIRSSFTDKNKRFMVIEALKNDS